MSLANASVQPDNDSLTQQHSDTCVNDKQLKEFSQLQECLSQVQEWIAPVWPLKDYVAVNPYAGLAHYKFLAAHTSLRSLSKLELLMPIDYYKKQFKDWTLKKADLDAAVDELVADGISGAERINVNKIVVLLSEDSTADPAIDLEHANPSHLQCSLRTLSQTLDDQTGSNWGAVICEEISKCCSAHYDQGQASWRSPWQDLSLYQAWHEAFQLDRRIEIAGISGFRKFVSQLPDDPKMALALLLNQLGVPPKLWSDFLYCQALSMPGWSAWAKYQFREADRKDKKNEDFVGLLAIRLAYEVALSQQAELCIDWPSVEQHHVPVTERTDKYSEEELLRYVLLKADEVSFREQLLNRLASKPKQQDSEALPSRSLAQMVFCIDVRSERMRRHLETTASDIKTYGFAGFFGLPIEFVGLGESEGSSQVPVLISPRFKIHENIESVGGKKTNMATERRSILRFLRKSWKDFQTSAVSTFASVETTGLFYSIKLFARSFGLGRVCHSCFDGVLKDDQARLAPSLQGLDQQGISNSMQADMAESILRGIGIIENFARLVIFCGHGSQTENNPLKAGLDCGACGGHSGEANARVAAKLLNQTHIRETLKERGIEIPEDTHFVAALHNTTTDEIKFFDLDCLPWSHTYDLEQVGKHAELASHQTSSERLSVLPGPSVADLLRRSRDWSETRPEWGLAGNAAFIAAPRSLTESVSLEGRAFLHSYDFLQDPEFAVLEQIMTAPLVVANWINMQYYASTVDPHHFGSGNKTIHNVVGRFGILSGNGGDLTTGLPWQSIHDGEHYQHHPLRLLAIIAAPREAINTIIGKHESVASLLNNGWLQLVAIEDNDYFRYTEQREWETLSKSGLQLEISKI